MFCSHCGSQLPPGARFCTNCGASLEPATPQQPQQSYQQPPQQPCPPQQQPYQPQQQTYTAAPPYQQPSANVPPQQPSGYAPYPSAPVPPSATGGYGAYAAAPARSKGIHGWVKALIAIIIVAAIAVGGYLIYQHFFDRDAGIKKTLNNFETAYNKMDLNGVLDCLDPAYTSFLNGITSLVGGFTGIDVSTILDGMLAIAPMLPDEIIGSERPAIHLTIDSIEHDGNARAYVTVDYDLSFGEARKSGTETITMIEIDGTWYISLEGALW